MKKVDILFGGSLKEVHGINYVTNAFVSGKKYFEKYGLQLNHIYSPDGCWNCIESDKLPIGCNINTRSYKIVRKFRLLLKFLLSSEILVFAWLKFYLNALRPAQKTIKSFLKNHGGDFIIFQDSMSAYYYYKNKSIAHKKAILILHCGEEPYEQLKLIFPAIFKYKKSRKLFEGMHEFAMSKVDCIVYLSKRAMAANKVSCHGKTFIYNGINDLATHSFHIRDLAVNIVCVGSMNYHKGQDVLIDAVYNLPVDIRKVVNVFLVGGGPQEHELRKKVEKYGLDSVIHIMGVRNDVADILKSMDVFVLPSLSEGMPISIIEAMRQGLYILATDTGGCAEMITSDFGRLVTRDIKELSKAIEDVVTQGRCTSLSQQASRRYYEQNFTLQSMIEKYSQTLLSI